MSPGKGNQDAKGQFGNLLLRIKVRPHAKFVRKGSHLIVSQPITIAQAVLGAKIQVETPYGMKEVSIPAGTQFGETVVAKREGIQRGNQKGDLIIML